MSATPKQVRRAIDRDPSFRTLRMCVKYLDKVCAPQMRVPTMRFLWDKFVTHAKAELP
jgi:hypothetical protein